MPYVRRPGHFMSDVKYSHVVNDLARRMINALSTELPWVLAALPRGVYSVCDRALVTINFASALHRDRRDKVSTHTGPPYMSLVSLAYSLSLSLSLTFSFSFFVPAVERASPAAGRRHAAGTQGEGEPQCARIDSTEVRDHALAGCVGPDWLRMAAPRAEGLGDSDSLHLPRRVRV